MVISYPAIFTPVEDGAIMVQVPDVPMVLTYGYSEEEAVSMAREALVLALNELIHSGREVPFPSPPGPGQRLVALGPQLSAKLEIYQAMRKRGWSFSRLGRALGRDAAYARRLLNLYRSAYFAHLEAALRVLGKRLEVRVVNAA